MPFSASTKKIVASLVIAGAMIGASFWFSGPGIRQVGAASAEELLRAYVSKDTDGDGLSDWQETLYKTDPSNPNSVSEEMNDADAVAAGLLNSRFSPENLAQGTPPEDVPGVDAAPETLTDEFAKKFLENYIRVRESGPLTEADMVAFVESALRELVAAREDRYAINEVVLGSSGKEAVAAYVEELDALMTNLSTAVDEKDVLDYFSDFVTNNDISALKEIAKTGAAYEKAAQAIMGIRTPLEVSGKHVEFANGFARLGSVVGDMAVMDSDPLRGLVGLLEYTDTLIAFEEILMSYRTALNNLL